MLSNEERVSSEVRPFWVATHPGLVRSSNQDCALVQARRTINQTDAWKGSIPASHAWAAVADGMGGHEAGNIASELTIAAVLEGVSAVVSEHEFADLARTANRRIFEAMRRGEGGLRMGSTLVAASLRSSTALIANVGDSRAYQFSAEGLRQLSADHTANVGSSPRRHHALTQSLGGSNFEVPIRPHVVRVTLGVTDGLLLCSDGLTDMITDLEISELLLAQPSDPATALVQAALAAGGRDNVTAILIGPAQHL
jgi:protein phosphatase